MAIDTVPRLDNEAIQDLDARTRGQVIRPADDGYDAARAVWNGMIDRRPELIVRCAGVADVIEAVRFGRQQSLQIAVRGGGHNVAGFGTCDGGLVIDLGPMKGVTVDAAARTAKAQAGLTWAEFDHETQAFGLATTGGLISSTGLAGFTLGGGIGWLLRKHGLTIDNLLSVELVTADGELVRANAAENAELFWGVRGGGGNFGIVTSFEYRLHPVGPIVLGGALFYTMDQAPAVMRRFRTWAKSAPEELTTLMVFLTAPPEPFVPPALVGTQMLAVALCYAGDIERGQTEIAELRSLTPAIDLAGPIPYTALQRMFDASAPRGIRSYWKTAYLDELSEPVVDMLLENAQRMQKLSPFCAIHVHHAGGAASRASGGETAFGRRDAQFVLNLPACWMDPAQDAEHIAWVRETHDAISRFAGNGAYLNFLGGEDGEERVRAAYGADTYARLAALKRQYDPENVFRLNQNVRPAK
ncbi:MAG: FAD-binding oxidoreductase [Chloroflexi bacterium]|nr:FAD-binding oxidoreductase [Chloroflexota bacterium]